MAVHIRASDPKPSVMGAHVRASDPKPFVMGAHIRASDPKPFGTGTRRGMQALGLMIYCENVYAAHRIGFLRQAQTVHLFVL